MTGGRWRRIVPRTVTSWPKHGVELRGTVVQLQVGPVSGRGRWRSRGGVLAAAAPHERQPPPAPERGRKGILSSRATARPDKSFSQAVRTEIVRAISDTVFAAANYARTMPILARSARLTENARTTGR